MPANRMTLPTLAFALASATLFAAQPAFADSMKTDSMKSTGTMQTHEMKSDCMSKTMTKKEKAACKDMMKKGAMKKHDGMMKTDTMKPVKSSGY